MTSVSRSESENDNLLSVGRLGVLEERVHGIENKLSEISREITALLKDFQDRAKTPWANIISACGVTLTVMSMFGYLALSPLRDDTVELKDELRSRLKVNEEIMVPRSEHIARWYTYETRHDDLVKQVDKLAEQVLKMSPPNDILIERNERLNRLEDRIAEIERLRQRDPATERP